MLCTLLESDSSDGTDKITSLEKCKFHDQDIDKNL